MATEEQLMSFENVLHFGFLAVAGLYAYPLLYPEVTTVDLPDDYVTLRADGFAETGHYGYNGSSTPVPDQWTCTAIFTIVTKRLEDPTTYDIYIPTRHSQMRAKLREMLQRGRSSLYSINTFLPDHEIGLMVLTGTTHTFDPDPGADISIVTYDITFGIRPTSWPS